MKGHYLDTKHPIIVENLIELKDEKGQFKKETYINQ